MKSWSKFKILSKCIEKQRHNRHEFRNCQFTLKDQQTCWRNLAELMRLQQCKRNLNAHLVYLEKCWKMSTQSIHFQRSASTQPRTSPKYERKIKDIRIPASRPSKIISSSKVANGALYDHEPINDLVISWRREPLCVSHLFVQAWTDASFLTARHPSSAWSIESR